MTGRINEWKGQDVLVEAVVSCAGEAWPCTRASPATCFRAATPTWTGSRRLIADAGVADSVELVGFVEDVDDLFERSEVFVLPSIRPEPFGLALIEAMAQATPCIATDGGGPRKSSAATRRDCWSRPTTPPRSPMRFSACWRSPRWRAVSATPPPDDVRERFAIERTLDGVVAVYDKVLA